MTNWFKVLKLAWRLCIVGVAIVIISMALAFASVWAGMFLLGV